MRTALEAGAYAVVAIPLLLDYSAVSREDFRNAVVLAGVVVSAWPLYFILTRRPRGPRAPLRPLRRVVQRRGRMTKT